MLDSSAIEDILGAMSTDLLTEIREFLRLSGMGRSYFGKASCGNSELVSRLEAGRRVWPETEQKVRAFMAERLQKERAA